MYNIYYDMIEGYKQAKCHPQEDMKRRNITYKDCECFSIADSWRFIDCVFESELPSYMRVKEVENA